MKFNLLTTEIIKTLHPLVIMLSDDHLTLLFSKPTLIQSEPEFKTYIINQKITLRSWNG